MNLIQTCLRNRLSNMYTGLNSRVTKIAIESPDTFLDSNLKDIVHGTERVEE